MSLSLLSRRIVSIPSLSNEIDEFIQERESKPSKRETGWHVSEIAGYCPREYVIGKLTLKEKRTDKPVYPRVARMWDHGTAVHELHQEDYFGPMGILWGRWKCSRCDDLKWGLMPDEPHEECRDRIPLCQILCQGQEDKRKARGGCSHCGIWGKWEYGEVPVLYEKDGVRLIGSADGIIKIGNAWGLLELKTSNKSKFESIVENESAEEEHEAQGQTYANIINSDIGIIRGYSGNRDFSISEVVVFYINKDSSETKEFHIPVSKNGMMWANVPEITERAFRNRVLPERLDQCETKKSPRVKKCKKRAPCFSGKSWEELKRIGDKKNGRG